jgi:hypothetical protein
MRIVLLAAAALSVCACGTTPVVEKGVPCRVDPALLERCPPPVGLTEGLTYGELLKLMQQDRAALAACGVRGEALVKAITACTEEMEKFNQRLGDINKATR